MKDVWHKQECWTCVGTLSDVITCAECIDNSMVTPYIVTFAWRAPPSPHTHTQAYRIIGEYGTKRRQGRKHSVTFVWIYLNTINMTLSKLFSSGIWRLVDCLQNNASKNMSPSPSHLLHAGVLLGWISTLKMEVTFSYETSVRIAEVVSLIATALRASLPTTADYVPFLSLLANTS
jgi:hypothetical protein